MYKPPNNLHVTLKKTQNIQHLHLYEHTPFTFVVELHLNSLLKKSFDDKPFGILLNNLTFIIPPNFGHQW